MAPIIIDCDPGIDDAIALLLALAAPEFTLQGVTVVAGNVPVQTGVKNASHVLALVQRQDIPLIRGCDQPVFLPLQTAEDVHGSDGLAEMDWRKIPAAVLENPLQTHAVSWLIETLRQSSAPVTLCMLGPLTNLALALRQAPDICSAIAEIIVMGGAFRHPGNTTPVAEFNFAVDPHAAAMICQAHLPLTIIPLDCTHQALMTEEVLQKWPEDKTESTQILRIVKNWMQFYGRFDRERYGIAGGPLHDPCVIACLLAPELFRFHHCPIRICTDSGPNLGQSLADWHHILPDSDRVGWSQARIATHIDSTAFFALLQERLKNLPC